jgi:hypothetical protein
MRCPNKSIAPASQQGFEGASRRVAGSFVTVALRKSDAARVLCNKSETLLPGILQLNF